MATLYSLSDGNPVQSLLLRKCLPKVKHFDELGIERFVHDIVNEMIHGDIDKTPYAAFKAEDLKTIFESFKIFITQCINLSLTKEQYIVNDSSQLVDAPQPGHQYQMLADLSTFGCGDDDSKFVVTAILARKEEIRQKFASNSVRLNDNYLVDFDWKVHVTLASDTVSQCREPLLLLSLRLGKNDNENFKELILELTRDDLDSFISQLETLNEELVKLKF